MPGLKPADAKTPHIYIMYTDAVYRCNKKCYKNMSSCVIYYNIVPPNVNVN